MNVSFPLPPHLCKLGRELPSQSLKDLHPYEECMVLICLGWVIIVILMTGKGDEMEMYQYGYGLQNWTMALEVLRAPVRILAGLCHTFPIRGASPAIP